MRETGKNCEIVRHIYCGAELETETLPRKKKQDYSKKISGGGTREDRSQRRSLYEAMQRVVGHVREEKEVEVGEDDSSREGERRSRGDLSKAETGTLSKVKGDGRGVVASSWAQRQMK